MKWRKRRISAEGIFPSVTAHPRCPQAAAPKRPNAEPQSTHYGVRGHWFCLDSASATPSLSICNTKMPAHEWDPLKSKKQINLDWRVRAKRIKVQGPRSCWELLLGKKHRCPLGLHFFFFFYDSYTLRRWGLFSESYFSQIKTNELSIVTGGPL